MLRGALIEEGFLCKADMLVMGLAVRHGLDDGASGSIAEHVLASSPIPVFLLRAGGAKVLQLRQPRDDPAILVPLDGSRFAEAALPVAAELATQLGGHITLMQVVPLAGSTLPPAAAAWDVCAVDMLLAESRAYLREVAVRFAREHQLEAAHLAVHVGQPADAILDAARTASADAVPASPNVGKWSSAACLGK